MDTSPAGEKEESLTHRFAAALLVPEEHAFRELGRERQRLDWGELKMLKRKYGFSMAAWIRRARDLKIISEHHYKTLNIELASRGWRTREPVEYLGDEEPIQLKQMIQRAVAEGLVALDRYSHLDLTVEPLEEELMPKSGYPSATELLDMDDLERESWMKKMFDLAQGMDFEVFEAYGEEEF